MDAEEQARHVSVESAATIAAAAAAPLGTDLRRFYAFQVINEFSFTAGIWIIFLQGRGFSLAEIVWRSRPFISRRSRSSCRPGHLPTCSAANGR